MAEGNEPKVVATCPVCKKEFIADGKSRLIVQSYLVPLGQAGNQIQMGASMPKIICIGCGVEFFTEDSLMELRKRAAGEVSNIIVPQTRVKLN